MAASKTVHSKNEKQKFPSKKPPQHRRMTREERREKYTQLARERRNKRLQMQKSKNLICFQCRQKGHVSAHCPNNPNESKNSSRICYKCGSSEHALSACPKVQHKSQYGDLPYAECYVCGKKGHLASQCEQNDRGVYVHGGACRICGSKRHLLKDCPQKKQEEKDRKADDSTQASVVESLLEGGATDGHPGASSMRAKKKKRVVNF